ncbi:MAG: thiamine pyrophosphate-dependent acetolactate synthase large subunit-like protein [Psychromonas sp.]|jgi:thiamine pyrophosphate-dependent acetolactate synthase large subunit-like protein|uniref:hypothetical protein n=1 Tax=Psychromonas sp. TaxID=1884585 RepID=UPI0039E68EC4
MIPSNCETAFRFLIIYPPSKAEASGLKGIHVDDPEKLADAMTEMINHLGQGVNDSKIDLAGNKMPKLDKK